MLLRQDPLIHTQFILLHYYHLLSNRRESGLEKTEITLGTSVQSLAD